MQQNPDGLPDSLGNVTALHQYAEPWSFIISQTSNEVKNFACVRNIVSDYMLWDIHNVEIILLEINEHTYI